MKKKPFLVIFLTVFMDLVGFGIVIPLNPFLARQFGADPLSVGLLMAVFSLLQFVFSPLWGQLSDRWGRRPIILISVLGSSVSHLWFGFADTLTGLFLARMLAGLFGGNISAAMAAMADLTPPNERSKGMGLVGAAFGLGFIFGPFIGGILADVGRHFGDQPPYGASFPALIAAAICFVNFLLAWMILPETRDPSVAATKRHSRLALTFHLLRQPVVGGLLWVYFLSTLAMAHMEASLFMMVQDRFSLSLSTASMGFAYVGVVMALTQGLIIRRTLPKWGEARSYVLGLTLMMISFLGVAFAPNLWMLGLAVTILALGSGFSNPALTGSLSLLTSRDQQGGTMGVNQSLSALGRILGPAAGGWIYREVDNSAPFVVAAILSLLALIVGWFVRDRVPHSAKASGHE